MDELDVGTYVCNSESGKTNIYVSQRSSTASQSGHSNLENGTIVIVGSLSGTYTKIVWIHRAKGIDTWALNETNHVWKKVSSTSASNGLTALYSNGVEVATKDETYQFANSEYEKSVNQVNVNGVKAPTQRQTG